MKSKPIHRRHFLLTSSTAAASACFWKPLSARGQTSDSASQHLDLNGAWEFSRSASDEWLPAMVPGCVHTDLMAAGKIPDPFVRDNERSLQWIGDAVWIYRRSFHVSARLLRHERVALRCEGLDTLAQVKVNGIEIGLADNMFRRWEFDLRSVLKPGENRIEITFESPLATMRERQASRVLYEWVGPHEPRGRAWVRKEPCNFGWDWGPVLITCGIWRNIHLVAFDHARLEDVCVSQDHSVTGKVNLNVAVRCETTGPRRLSATATIRHATKPPLTRMITLDGNTGSANFEISDPDLWWPAGMGAQPLYEVAVELRDESGTVIDNSVRRVGLRTLKLLPKDEVNSLRFEVNGVPFFAKGANMIPADPFPNRVSSNTLRRFVSDAVAANMNSLRFWGGGYYEDDALFDACDEMGVCVWMDFKFACSTYPAFDESFMENVRQEARDQLRRLRHHPCIAVWCGNNEINLMVKDEWSDESMSREDYDKLFKELLGGEVAALAPQANYVSGSPECGDEHYWQVWHGGKPFEDFRTLTGFMSEFGFQAFPCPKTVDAYTAPEDRTSVMTPVMRWHQRSGTTGNDKIVEMIPRYFHPPKDFENTLWLSQITQGLGIKTGAEHWRRTMPKSMGCLFWQYNDCWPVASWSSVDYFGRWKALQFMARRFYAPLLVSGLEDAAKGHIEVHVSSDLLEACTGQLAWRVTDTDGEELTAGTMTIELPPRRSAMATTLDLQPYIKQGGPNKVLTWLRLIVDGQPDSENLVCFVPPKDIPLADPNIESTIGEIPGGFLVTVTAAKPALWCWLDLDREDATYSDNFVHLAAGRPATVMVRPARPMTRAEFTRALRVRSLHDTFSNKQ